jgi:hypothetical protein
MDLNVYALRALHGRPQADVADGRPGRKAGAINLYRVDSAVGQAARPDLNVGRRKAQPPAAAVAADNASAHGPLQAAALAKSARPASMRPAS